MKLPTSPTHGPSRGVPRTSGSFSGLSLRILVEAARRQRVAGDVGHDLGEVADAALGIEHAGLFAAGRAEADEFHRGSSLWSILLAGGAMEGSIVR